MPPYGGHGGRADLDRRCRRRRLADTRYCLRGHHVPDAAVNADDTVNAVNADDTDGDNDNGVGHGAGFDD